MLYLALGPRAARHRVRPGRAVRLGLLRRAADPAQAPRPGRARRVPRLGSADGRRDVPGRDRDGRIVGPARVGAVRAARDVACCSASTSTRSTPTRSSASGHCRSSSARRVPGQVGSWLMILFYPLTILAAVVGWIGPWVLLVVLGIPRLLDGARDVRASRSPTAPPAGATRAGRCGSSAARSSTPAARADCSPWACCSTRWCRSPCPGCSPRALEHEHQVGRRVGPEVGAIEPEPKLVDQAPAGLVRRVHHGDDPVRGETRPGVRDDRDARFRGDTSTVPAGREQATELGVEPPTGGSLVIRPLTPTNSPSGVRTVQATRPRSVPSANHGRNSSAARRSLSASVSVGSAKSAQ